MAEEAGVEPTEDAWRPPTDLKSARATGPDALPSHGPAGQPNASAPRATTRASPIRRVAPILSRYSRMRIVRLRPTPEWSLKAAAVKVPSDERSASSQAISARRAKGSGKKKRLSATTA